MRRQLHTLFEFIKNIFSRKPNPSTLIQFFRYGFVATISLFVDFGSLILLKEVAGLNYLFAAAIAFMLGLITNYLLSIFWVFTSRNVKSPWMEFLIFSGIGLVGLGLTELILWLLTDEFGLYYMASKAIATLLVYFWNFFVRKYVLYREDNNA